MLAGLRTVTAPTGKRALIVDDSKSARAFLTRLLEKHGLDVEAVENAEQAIEHLSHARPDVIFMDHLMPGMDGFQAVQSIKHNPRTATIPIMMYTSQEGELYLGQARALGAMGVLPKQVKHAELATALFQLGLLADRRSSTGRMPALVSEIAADPPAALGVVAGSAESQPSSSPSAEASPSASAGGSDQPAAAAITSGAPAALSADALIVLRPMVESAVREQVGELRRQLPSLFSEQSERLLDDVRAAVAGASLATASTPAPEPAIVRASSRIPWFLAAVATLAAVAFATLWWREVMGAAPLAAGLERAPRVEQVPAATGTSATAVPAAAADRGASLAAGAALTAVAVTRSAPASLVAMTAPEGGLATTELSAVRGDALLPGDPRSRIVRAVPYGETPLTGERLETLRVLLEDLLGRGYRGVVTVTSYPGRFCLMGNLGSGYSLAAAAAAAARCDTVGNPFDELLSPAQREPVALANLIGSVRQQSGGAVRVELVNGDEAERLAAYPPETEALTAGEWNRAAVANNRVEIRLDAVAAP
jgi:CheY-like chemotaxis protein